MGLFDKLKKTFMREKKEEIVEEPIEHSEETAEESATEVDTQVTQSSEQVEPVISESVTEEEEARGSSEDMTEADREDLTNETTENVAVNDSTAEETDTPETIEVHEEAMDEEPVERAEEAELMQEYTGEVAEPITEPKPERVEEINEVVESLKEELEADSVIEEEEALAVTEKAKKMEKGLEKTRKTFGQRMNELFAKFRSVDEDFFEELEESLIGADVGFETSMKIADALREEVKLRNLKKRPEVQNAIIEKLVDLYEEEGIDEDNQIHIQPDGLTIILFVGVNGVGKTTSIGKLAHQYRLEGKKVLMAAADTFRAGAIDQLVVWGERAGVEVVRGNAGGDPAAVVYDAIERAKEEKADILLVDTAGRLQNKVNLMNELEKIKRVIQREVPDGPHEVLLVVDATTGQNAMVQAKQFKETTDVTGLVLTKLDGTAKGGIVLAIRNELHLPVKLVGLGEKIDDLQEFNPNEFVYGLFKELIEEE